MVEVVKPAAPVCLTAAGAPASFEPPAVGSVGTDGVLVAAVVFLGVAF